MVYLTLMRPFFNCRVIIRSSAISPDIEQGVAMDRLAFESHPCDTGFRLGEAFRGS